MNTQGGEGLQCTLLHSEFLSFGSEVSPSSLGYFGGSIELEEALGPSNIVDFKL